MLCELSEMPSCVVSIVAPTTMVVCKSTWTMSAMAVGFIDVIIGLPHGQELPLCPMSEYTQGANTQGASSQGSMVDTFCTHALQASLRQTSPAQSHRKVRYKQFGSRLPEHLQVSGTWQASNVATRFGGGCRHWESDDWPPQACAEALGMTKDWLLLSRTQAPGSGLGYCSTSHMFLPVFESFCFNMDWLHFLCWSILVTGCKAS